MKTKVAVVLPYFGNGGAENMVSRVVSNIDQDKVQAEVICIYGDPLGNRLEKAVQEKNIPIRFIRKGKGFSFFALVRLWAELSEYRPDVINTHLSACVYCIPWVLFHKPLMLHTVHNIPRRELTRIKQIPMRFIYKTGKAVPIAISEEIRRQLISYYRLKKAPELIYNPVDTKRFRIDSRHFHEGIVVVTAGRLSEQKNQKLLIDTVKELKKEGMEIKLIILGDGPLKQELQEYVEKAGLGEAVKMPGNVDNIEDYFAEADIFALSSIYEGLPLVILEAMAAGLPILTTDVGGIRDVLGEEGILVPPGDRQAYRDALRKLVGDQELREKLGKEAKKNSDRYDSGLIAEQYAEAFEKHSKSQAY